MTTIAELQGYPKLRLSETGEFIGHRAFRVPWDERLQFLRELLGEWRVTGGKPSWTPSKPFPDFPQLIPVNVAVDSFGELITNDAPLTRLDAGTASYEAVKIEVEYRPRQTTDDVPGMPTPPAGTFLLYSATIGAEMTQVPGRTFVWDLSGGTAPVGPDAVPGRLTPTEDFTLDWHRVPRPPWTAMRAMRGKVNSVAFLGHAIETVLYLGSVVRRQFQFLDVPIWLLSHRFAVKEQHATSDDSIYGWNHLFRGEADGGEHVLPILTADETEAPYQFEDFLPLFEFEPAE